MNSKREIKLEVDKTNGTPILTFVENGRGVADILWQPDKKPSFYNYVYPSRMRDGDTIWSEEEPEGFLPPPQVGEHIWLKRGSGEFYTGTVKETRHVFGIGDYVSLGAGDRGHYVPGTLNPHAKALCAATIVAWGLVEPEPLKVKENDWVRMKEHATTTTGIPVGGAVGQVFSHPWCVEEPDHEFHIRGMKGRGNNVAIRTHEIAEVVDQPQPEEPTGLGAVVRLGVKPHVRVPVYGVNKSKPWVCTGDGARSSWADLLACGVPIKVES